MERYWPTLSEAGRRWLHFGLLLLAIGVLAWGLYSLRAVFTPLLAALALAYILDPLVSWAERRGVHRLAAVAVLYCLVAAGLLVAIFYLAALLIEQVVELRQNLDSYLSTLEGWLAAFTRPVTGGAAETQAVAARRDWWGHIIPALQTHGAAVLDGLMSSLAGAVGSLFGWLTVLVLLPMYTFFFLWKLPVIVCTVRDHLPADWRDGIVYFATTTDRAVANFFRGRLLVCLVIAISLGAGWTIVGVPYGLLLGLIAGALSPVSYTHLTLPTIYSV